MKQVPRGQEASYLRIRGSFRRKNCPASARARIRKFLNKCFAKNEEGLKLILASLVLALRNAEQPDKLILLLGSGGDGKSLLVNRLLANVFGTAFAQCPASVLQKDEEFRKQGGNWVTAKLLAFDEANPKMGLQEDLVKVLAEGGPLELRRNLGRERAD